MMYAKAIQTALKAHEHQVRKIDATPYVIHPLEVGMLLSKYGLSDDIVIAGILHDTVEDTALTLSDIEENFGETIAMYVDFCSEKDKCDSWENRKRDYLRRMEEAPLEALYVICADKVSNTESLLKNISEYGTDIWDRFNAGFEKQRWYYREALIKLERIKPHPLHDLLSQNIDALFG